MSSKTEKQSNRMDAIPSVSEMEYLMAQQLSEPIVLDILRELKRAETKHPKWPEDLIHRAAIVGEESGELIRASLNFKYEGGSIEEIRNEAVQTAAMCIRLIREL